MEKEDRNKQNLMITKVLYYKVCGEQQKNMQREIYTFICICRKKQDKN